MDEQDLGAAILSTPPRTIWALMAFLVGKLSGIAAVILMWVNRPVAGILLVLAFVCIGLSIYFCISQIREDALPR